MKKCPVLRPILKNTRPGPPRDQNRNYQVKFEIETEIAKKLVTKTGLETVIIAKHCPTAQKSNAKNHYV